MNSYVTSPRYEIGFVYVLTNPYYVPGLVKIGATGLLAEDRAKKLFTTGVPAPFTVEYRMATSRPMDVEATAHQILADQRVNSSREFFFASVDQAVEAVRIAALERGGIGSWSESEIHRLGAGDRLALSLEAGQTFCHLRYQDGMSLLSGLADRFDIYQAHSEGDLLEIMVTNSPKDVSSFSEGHRLGADDPVPYLDRERKAVNGMINGREVLVPGERLVWLPAPEQSAMQPAVVFEAMGYCQLVSRTWSPRFLDASFPLIMNFPTIDHQTREWNAAVEKAQRLPPPRMWEPRPTSDGAQLEYGSVEQPPEFWLPQLKPRTKKK